MSEIEKYTRDGETWYMTDKECPECDFQVSSNGTVYKCSRACGWWELINDD